MRLTAKDLDEWRAWLDQAPPRPRAMVLALMARVADLKERNRRQLATLEAERRHLADLERLVDGLTGVRTREVGP